jgi:hypothetical protein
VIADQLLRDCFIHRQKRSVRPRAGVLLPDQIEKRGEMHLLRVVAGVRLDQIEVEIGARARQRGQRLRPSVDGQCRRLVPEVVQRIGNGLDVGLLLPLLLAVFRGRGLDVRAGIFFVAFERVEQNGYLQRAGLRCFKRFFPVRNVIASVVI